MYSGWVVCICLFSWLCCRNTLYFSRGQVNMIKDLKLLCGLPINTEKKKYSDMELLHLRSHVVSKAKEPVWTGFLIQFQRKTTLLQCPIHVPEEFWKEGKSHTTASCCEMMGYLYFCPVLLVNLCFLGLFQERSASGSEDDWSEPLVIGPTAHWAPRLDFIYFT